jgi:hypothetical protein
VSLHSSRVGFHRVVLSIVNLEKFCNSDEAVSVQNRTLRTVSYAANCDGSL